MSKERSHLLDIRKHLLTGVSYMIPLVVAGGILVALSFLVGGYKGFETEGSFADYLMRIGSGALGLIIPILAAFIAYSIADRAGLAPGLVAGVIAVNVNSGFLGGLVGGLLAGYLVYYLKKVTVPNLLKPLMAILFIPLVSALVIGLVMLLVLGPPIANIMDGLSNWLESMSTVNLVLFGALLGAMQAFDMGGPVDKTAYTFGVAMLAEGEFAPMAAIMVGGMTPPIALAIAAKLRPKKFSFAERKHADAAWIMGLSFITEGAIPFASADPLRVIPAQMIGSAVAGGLSMAFGCLLQAPHGGIFVLPLITNPVLYLVALVIGVAVTTALVILVKKDLTIEQLEDSEIAEPMGVLMGTRA
jgi:PTS system fructose-specific IIC component